MLAPARARCRSMAVSGTTPTRRRENERPAQRRIPDEVSADRAADLDPISNDGDVVEERGDLAIWDSLHGDVERFRPLGLRSDGIAAFDAASVLGRQSQVDVLACSMWRPVRDLQG